MAEIPKINDIASQLSTASRLVVSTDFFWVYMGDGTQVKIPAEFVRAYLTNGITPVIDENGNWIIGGKPTGVKAEGVTPMLRSSLEGIEVSYDKGKTWSMVVLYSELNPDLQPLIDAYNAIVESEQGRVDAETSRVQAETNRQNAWAAWFENASTGVKALWTSWFNATKKAWSDWFGATESAGVRKTWSDWFTAIKNAWNGFNTTASQAETARVNAENTRRTQESSRVSAEQTRVSEFATIKSDATSATSAANSAATKANAASTSANNAANSANSAAQNANEKAALADTAATNANNKAVLANTAAANSDKQTALCKSATNLAEELNAHPQMQGSNGNWWKWNPDTDTYEDTGIIARGGGMYPMVRSRRNHVIWYDSTDGFKERIVRRRNHTIIKL